MEVTGSSLSPADAQPIVEGKTDSPAPEAKDIPKDDFEDKFLRLTRKERALQQAQAELKAKQAEIEKAKAEYESLMNRKNSWKQNPYDFLDFAGVTYEQLTEAMLDHGQPVDKLTEIERKLQLLEEKDSKEKQARQLEQEKQIAEQTQRAIDAFQSDLAKYIDSSDYELIKANDGQELVFELIQQDFQRQIKEGNKEPQIMKEKACEQAEAFFESQLDRFLQLKKVQNRLQPKEESQETKSSFQAPVNQPRQSVTLTNSMKASSEAATSSSRRPSDQELFARSAAMIKFT